MKIEKERKHLTKAKEKSIKSREKRKGDVWRGKQEWRASKAVTRDKTQANSQKTPTKVT